MNQRGSLLRLEVPLGVLGVALLAAAALCAINGIPAWIPPAPIVRAGVPSPLTGMTRSFVALASGDFRASFAWHPLGPLVFACCAVLPAVALVSWIRGRRIEVLARLAGRRSIWLVLALVFAAAWARQLTTLG